MSFRSATKDQEAAALVSMQDDLEKRIALALDACTEPPVAANVQSATPEPPPIHDGPAQENTPPPRAEETPPVQGQKGGLSQSVGGPPVLDANEIAALVKRGKDFAANGDLVICSFAA